MIREIQAGILKSTVRAVLSLEPSSSKFPTFRRFLIKIPHFAEYLIFLANQGNITIQKYHLYIYICITKCVCIYVCVCVSVCACVFISCDNAQLFQRLFSIGVVSLTGLGPMSPSLSL